MNKINNRPRILKIQSVKGFVITCIFNNGEMRTIDFEKLFSKWKIKRSAPEYALRTASEFKKVKLDNQTLSWPNILVTFTDLDGKKINAAFDLSPDILYAESQPSANISDKFLLGADVRKYRLERGISQEELARLSGTSKTYISRLENDLIQPEIPTLYKIVELGLRKKLKIEIA